MKNFIIGVLVGMTVAGTAWAYSVGVTLQDETGNATGITSNPLYIEAI
jgi:hypothetical protein